MLAQTSSRPSDFEEYLVSKGVLERDGTRSNGQGSSYRSMLERSALDTGAFADAVSAFHDLPRASLDAMRAGQPVLEPFSIRFLRDLGAFPYETADGELRLAIADPSEKASLRAIELTLGRPCKREVAAFEEIEMLLRSAASVQDVAFPATDDVAATEWTHREDDDFDTLRDMAAGAPVVRAVNQIFETAVELRATDIHIEPFRGSLQVRLRIDGLLQPLPAPPPDMARAVISRIKILAGLNITERRLPQDGRARIRLGRLDLDLRVATMPTAHGEAAILRVLERNPRLLDLTRLGFSPRDREVVSRHLQAPHGLVIVAGPTGSGKTTTLASALSMLNSPSRKILTIEDPIEYEITGVNQSQVKPSIGLTFASALRAFLRQDPDVIMVGEMRDGETAKIGIQAALTGHLVLTTLHTNTAAAAITRLLDMGVEQFLLASTIRCIVGQRLVRVLCPECRRLTEIDEQRLAREPRFSALGLGVGDTIGEPVGCGRCGGSGYRGRQGVFEVLEVTEPIRRLIGARADDALIEQAACDQGMTSLIQDGLTKCRGGITSVDEILRVTMSR